jgi:FkbM family methyltransferase
MYFIRRTLYYLTSLITIVREVRNWPVLFQVVMRGGHETRLELRDGTHFIVRSLMDAWIIKETNLDKDYERYSIPIQDGWNVVDIGAGLGDFTVFAARRTPHGQVFAYEPAPDSVALLERNLALNGITNVSVFPNAVSAYAGDLILDVSGNVAVQYRTVTGVSADDTQIAVQSVTMAGVLAMLPRGMCDFLKMDCEGAEYGILLDLDDTILRRVKRICLEYHLFVTQHSEKDLVELFERRGWYVRVFPNRVRKELGILYAERQ